MPDFFDKPFEEQVEKIIKIENAEGLRLLQALIGVRSSATFIKYYSGFIITKINIMYARLYGEYKLKEFCLEEYKKVLDAKFRETDEDIMGELVSKDKSFKDRDFDKIIPDSVGLRKLLNDKAKLVRDSIREDLKEVVLESIQDRNNRIKESASISDYRHCGSNKQIIEYVRSTDITGLCTMGYEQVLDIYDNIARKTIEEIDNEIINMIIESPGQGTEKKGLVKADAVVENLKREVGRISEQLKSTTKECKSYESEIDKYSDFIKEVKNRTLL
ncbi:hypothetical protein [Wolbachia endosymbiont (group A) of Beris morrisii]|uniref:hypothetical protein n=1 Tax=Wolbachia endosymbiont (group A) of Beris morrisii TaxID=3066139 RepID=UPI0033400DA7